MSDTTLSISHGYCSRKPYAQLMRGRPEESASHQHIAVYSKQDYDDFRARGWKPTKEFTEMIRRAQYESKQEGYRHERV